MCVVSMMMDHYQDKWRRELDRINTLPPLVPIPAPPAPQIPQKDVEEFYKLLERARAYDKANSQPDCELEEKKQKLKELAKLLGVEIVFP